MLQYQSSKITVVPREGTVQSYRSLLEVYV